MTTDNYACNPRNTIPGSIYFDVKDVYTPDVEFDYRDEDLTPDSILNLFRGRYPKDVCFYIKLVSSIEETYVK